MAGGGVCRGGVTTSLPGSRDQALAHTASPNAAKIMVEIGSLE